MKLIIEHGAAVAEHDITGDVRIVLQEAALPPASAPEPSAPEPSPPPPVTEPPPDPAHAPEPPAQPPATARPAGMVRTLNPDRRLTFDSWNGNTRYNRSERLTVLRGDVATIGFKVQNDGGEKLPFAAAQYTLLVDGVQRATVDVLPGATQAEFALPLTGIEDGWRVLDIVGAPEETCAFDAVFVLRGDTRPPQDWMPVVTGSYRVSSGPHRIQWVPARDEPTILPLVPRPQPHFSDVRPHGDFWREELVPNRRGDLGVPSVSAEGIMSTANRQFYTVGDMVAKLPRVPLRDGPRGKAILGYITSLRMGTAAPDGVPLNNVFGTTPWSTFKVSATGTVVTTSGYRHRGIPRHWQSEPDLELVGDWSSIPIERRGYHELWAFFYDQSSTAVDTSAPRIPTEGNLHPHVRGPRAFAFDSQNDRICTVTHSPTSHAAPAKVDEFLTGLKDPWGGALWRDSLIVNERGSHRIVAYHKDTGELQRVILQGRALSRADYPDRLVRRLASLDEIRAEPVVGPEGGEVMDDWYYFGSAAMAQIRRVHLVTGELQIVVPSRSGVFVQLAVSDGTFLPRHTVFAAAWTNQQFGAPSAYVPDGNGAWVGHSLTSGGSSGTPRGRGTTHEIGDYAAAVAVGNGRLAYGYSSVGLIQLTASVPGDPVVDRTLYVKGKTRWFKDGLDQLHGDGGWGFYGLPQPWGHSPETDYYMTCHGHMQG